MSEHNPGMEYDEPEEAQGEALAEEDLSDEATETSDDLARSMALIERAATETTSAGDLVDAETGEVLKDAPGWDKTTRAILNRDGLEWAGRRLREVEEALAENHRAAAAELAEVEAKLRKAQERHAKADAPLLASRAFFDAAIRAYAEGHRAELLKGRRGKTARLPSGLVLAWKAGGGEYRWRKDMKPAEREAALLAWAKATADRVAVDLPPMVESVERPILANVKVTLAALDDPEEPRFTPPGLEYVPEHEELTVKVEGDK